MVVVSYSGKEINAKLVYYGAGLSGKTTNLESIYEAVPDNSRGKMVSMKTQSDRTLFFDLLPLDLGEIMGFKTRFLLYTVPGQVFYNATRKLVLKGADAIVFVADSEVGKMEENKESLANLKANLAEYGLSLDNIPWVIQYNKRDLPNVYTSEELNAELNPGGKVPFFEAVATQGKGVFETFRGISHLLMEKVTRELRRGPGQQRPMSQAPGSQPPAMPAIPGAPQATQPQAPASAGPSAPAMSPSRAISEEARKEPAEPAPTMFGSSIDYGREIELPGEVGAKASAQPAAPAPAAPANEPEHATVTPRVESPRAEAPAPAPVTPPTAYVAPAAAPAPRVDAPRVEAPKPEVPKAEAPKPAVHAAPEPTPVTDSMPAPRPPVPFAPPQAAKPEPQVVEAKVSADAKDVVVPIAIPKGGSREIVLRIVITDREAA